jgi:arginyl-tRNA synthetase
MGSPGAAPPRHDGGMPALLSFVTQRLQAAFDAVEPGADPVLRPSDRADFQANGALALAKRQGGNPRQVAADIVGHLDTTGWCAGVEVAGPGFINVTLDDGWVAQRLADAGADPSLGVERRVQAELVIVDYASPNVAKEMHVGHLRSTIIGDALCRMLAFVGDRVVGENHIGDWGTPFGMLIEHLVDLGEEAGAEALSVGELEGFYRGARTKFDADAGFAERSRGRVVALQAGETETMRLWGVLVGQSLTYIDGVLGRLGVLLTRQDVRGESSYNHLLAGVVDELTTKGLLVQSEGALCVFPPGFAGRDGDPLPLIVRKTDGGYGYAATDLAGLRERFVERGADLSLYVVGVPQSQHLEMCFAVARLAGWITPPAQAVHVGFGHVLGADRKMFRTRDGGTEKLADLLDEAELRARAAVAAKNPDLDPAEAAEVARAVGIGAVKYADLSSDRTRDYVFDWDRMLAFEGNTAPYLQYAHARICSIFRRAAERGSAQPGPITLAEPAERALGIALLGLDAALRAALDTYSPHKLCSYLFDLAGTFTTFYENCPVLRAPDPEVRASRLALCDLTVSVLACGLGLLGIDAPPRM